MKAEVPVEKVKESLRLLAAIKLHMERLSNEITMIHGLVSKEIGKLQSYLPDTDDR